MSEHDNTNDPVEPAEPAEPPAEQPVPLEEPPAPAAKSRWRERTFRWRSVTAVAVAGVILGATGGAVTTALVADDGHPDHDFDRHRMGQQMGPGMPAVPPTLTHVR